MILMSDELIADIHILISDKQQTTRLSAIWLVNQDSSRDEAPIYWY